MKITLIRHGETAYNKERRIQGHVDAPLNDTGRAQARQLANLLNDSFDIGYSSDLVRASETAEILLKGQTALRTRPGLRERFMGPVQDMLFFDAKAMAAQEGKTMMDYGETGTEFTERLLAAWDELISEAKANGSENILIVSHGGALLTLLGALVKTKRVDPGNCAADIGSSCRNCSVTVIEDGVMLQYARQMVESIISNRELL